MIVHINGRKAVVKSDISFEYILENRSFTGADSFSLSIPFPMDCPENRAIFGHICRKDAVIDNILYECSICCGKTTINGCLAIVSVSESEVSCQLLKDRSASNYDPGFDKVYINELDLGKPSSTALHSNPALGWTSYDDGPGYVSLPWIDNGDVVHNDIVVDNNGYHYASGLTALSFQPYLLYVVRSVFDALGYVCDLTAWESSPKRHLLVCNTLPASWLRSNFADAMPHWSVTEFIENVESILDAEFDIDHIAKSIEFHFRKDTLESLPVVEILNVVDEFTCSVSSDEKAEEYVETRIRKYADSDNPLWPYLVCPWYMKSVDESNIVRYNTLSDLLSSNRIMMRTRSFHRGSNANKVLYAADVDTFFVFRAVREEFVETNALGHDVYDLICVPQPVNIFAPDGDADDAEDLDIMPVCIDIVDGSNIIRIAEVSSEGSEYSSGDEDITTRPGNSGMGNGGSLPDSIQPIPATVICSGAQSQSATFDKLYIGYWDGTPLVSNNKPYPIIDYVNIFEDWTYSLTGVSLRFNSSFFNDPIYCPDPEKMYVFKFLSDEIPNPRALFHIAGHRYVCKRLYATFTEDGMSQLLKGEFFAITD